MNSLIRAFQGSRAVRASLSLLALGGTMMVGSGDARADVIFDALEATPSGWNYQTTKPGAGDGGIAKNINLAHNGSHYGWQVFYFNQSTPSDWSALYKTFKKPFGGPVRSCGLEVFYGAPNGPVQIMLEMINPNSFTYIGAHAVSVQQGIGYNHLFFTNTYACSDSILVRVRMFGVNSATTTPEPELYIDDVSVTFNP